MSAVGLAGATSAGAVLVDARPVGHPTARRRGIGRYVIGLLRGLADIGVPVVALYETETEAEVLAAAGAELPLHRWSRQVVRDHAEAGTWYIATQLMLHPIPLDPIPRVITEARLPVAALMYDVIPYRFPERYLVEPDARNQAQLRARLARTVDSMLAISRFAAETASQELAYPIERIGVIGAGVEPQFVPAALDPHPWPQRVLPRYVEGYVVAVTGGDERKNNEGLLRAWGRVTASVRETHHLVIACAHSPAVLRRWQGWAEEAGVTGRVVFTGSLDDDEMVAILQGARLAVMPSFEEGFGLPVLEAAACAVPVICSNLTSLPEVLDEPAACFDPHDPDAIARAMERALVDGAHRDLLLAAGARAAERWTWTRVARDTVEVLSAHGPRWPRRLRRPADRIALAGPFIGSDSGIGGYDESVLEALRRRRPARPEHAAPGVVMALVDGSGTSQPTQATGDGLRMPVRAVGRFLKPWDVDHIVAALGSSPHHVATAHLAASAPCHVWLHEASLVGLHVGLAHASGSERWATDYVRSVIEANEPAELAASVADRELLDAERLHELGITMLSTVLERARSVIVSSDQAATIVRSVRPDGPALLVLPLAFPPATPPAGVPCSREIVAAGWLADNKAPLLALDLLARVAGVAASHDATLTFAGPALDETVERVRRDAARLGMTERVAITGRLDDAAYRGRIGSARVGLQLRSGGRGEMSAAVGDLVACGIPTVTTLATAGASSPGLQVVGNDIDTLAAAIGPLLVDDELWAAASSDALARARAWTFDNVAAALLEWLDDADDLDPVTIRHR